MEELGTLLAEREEEFYSYQNSASADDDYDDEEDEVTRVPPHASPHTQHAWGSPAHTPIPPSHTCQDADGAKKPLVDSIDYADDEDEDYEDDVGKDEM